MISLNKINKSFDRKVLNDISLEFKPGKIYLIKGISGSGKTTLLNILSGLDRNFDGEYIFYGNNVKELNNKQFKNFRSKIGYICQDSLLISNLSVKENLLFINNNEESINELSNLFSIKLLLEKHPNQLSGGERQRVSIVRSLLNDSKLIIADEPTSSLDITNSLEFAKEIEKIKNKDKIIIISTHKNLFDSIADEIINLNYGVVSNDKIKRKPVSSALNNEKNLKSDFNLKYNLLYDIKRNKKHHNIVLDVFLTLIFVAILFTISIKLNFEKSYVDYNSKIYPYQMVDLTKEQYTALKNEIEYYYDDYRVDGLGYTAYALFSINDSNFKIPGVISVGRFPKNDNEILINDYYVKSFFVDKNDNDILGMKIDINNKTFTISGIVNWDEKKSYEIYGSNAYYNSITSPAVFIPYESIKKIGTKNLIENPFTAKMVKLKDYKKFYLIETENEYLITSSIYCIWKNRIDNMVSSTNFISDISLIGILFLGIVSLLFIKNQIDLDLFYRKRELGYLQVFNVTKKRINFIVILEYLLKIIKPLLLSILTFLIGTLVIYVLTGFNISMSLLDILLFVIIIIIYSIIVVILPLIKYLKMDVIKLIK